MGVIAADAATGKREGYMQYAHAFRVFFLAGALLGGACQASAQTADELWQGLARDIFSGRAMTAGRDVVSL